MDSKASLTESSKSLAYELTSFELPLYYPIQRNGNSQLILQCKYLTAIKS